MSTTQSQSSLSASFKYSIFISLLICASASAKQPVVATYYVAAGNPVAVSNLPAKKLSHILYAFIALCGDNSGTNASTQKAIAIACEGKATYSAGGLSPNVTLNCIKWLRITCITLKQKLETSWTMPVYSEFVWYQS